MGKNNIEENLQQKTDKLLDKFFKKIENLLEESFLVVFFICKGKNGKKTKIFAEFATIGNQLTLFDAQNDFYIVSGIKNYSDTAFCMWMNNEYLKKHKNNKLNILCMKENQVCLEKSNSNIICIAFNEKKCQPQEIKDVFEFCKKVYEDKKELQKQKQNLYFRGQAANWDLNPSIYRHGEWLAKEAELNAQVVSDRPNDFLNCTTTFERLVKLKHYNQPSRLLDITSNPLIALFFACDYAVKRKSIGIVYEIFSETDKEKISRISDSAILLSALSNVRKGSCSRNKCLCTEKNHKPCRGSNMCEENNSCWNCEDKNKCKEKDDNNFCCSLLKEIVHQAKKESQSELYWNDLKFGELNQCILIHPPLNNNRIVQQQGHFILCGLNPEDFSKPPKALKKYFVSPKERQNKVFFFSDSTAQILLDELSMFGIDKYYVYDDLEKEIEVRKNILITTEKNAKK